MEEGLSDYLLHLVALTHDDNLLATSIAHLLTIQVEVLHRLNAIVGEHVVAGNASGSDHGEATVVEHGVSTFLSTEMPDAGCCFVEQCEDGAVGEVVDGRRGDLSLPVGDGIEAVHGSGDHAAGGTGEDLCGRYAG